MSEDLAKEDGAKVLRKEWALGLPRGGFAYYLKSRDNYVPFREDISDMFCEGEFFLAPTYKTYLDAMHFAENAGIKGRKDTDRSPRRPLTALTPPGGMYRYVFIPCTDAARALQQKLKLQPQTAEDLDNGVCPVDNAPFREGSDQFPVVECHAHPYSVAMDAFEKMNAYSNMLISQWHVLAWRMASIWNAKMKPPQWFAESAVYTMYDEDLTPSEASGYIPIKPNGLPAPEPISVLRDLNLAEDSCRKKAARWTIDVGPDADPPEDDPRRVVYAVRRSRRIQERAHPYRSLPSPIRSGPLRSPTRNAARALLTCKRNPVKNPPSWVSQNGRYSSHRFSSNDWAYFRYNVYLATPVET